MELIINPPLELFLIKTRFGLRSSQHDEMFVNRREARITHVVDTRARRKKLNITAA